MKIAMLIDGREPVFWWGQIHVKYLSEILVKNHDCKVDVFVRKLLGENGKKYVQNEVQFEGKRNLFRVGPTTTFFNVVGRVLSLITIVFFLLYKTLIKKYDVIHAHAYVSGLPAKIVGFLTKTPVIYTVHWTMWLDAKTNGILSRIERRLVCGIEYDLEISVSHQILKYSNVNKNIKIIHNGVDVLAYDEVKQPKKPSGFSLIFVWRFNWQKGIEHLIQAFHLLDKKLLDEKNVIVRLVGDGELKDKYCELISQYHLEKYFVFTGKLFGTDLIEEYKKSTVFVLPSLAEGQPLTLLEAFASRLPALVTDVGDNSYFVKNWESWWIVPPANETALTNAIEDMLQQDDILELWKMGYLMIKNSYTWDKIVERTYLEYQKLVKN